VAHTGAAPVRQSSNRCGVDGVVRFRGNVPDVRKPGDEIRRLFPARTSDEQPPKEPVTVLRSGACDSCDQESSEGQAAGGGLAGADNATPPPAWSLREARVEEVEEALLPNTASK